MTPTDIDALVERAIRAELRRYHEAHPFSEAQDVSNWLVTSLTRAVSKEVEDTIVRLRAENERRGEIVRDLTKALTGLTPGGSEYFKRHGDLYYADVDACLDAARTSGDIKARFAECHRKVAEARATAAEAEVERHKALHERNAKRFWLVLHEPGCVPERKGPWLNTGIKEVLRDFIKARPTAYIDVLTVDENCEPHVEHGPEWLQILDGRSMSVGSKHNARTREAHAEYHAALSTLQSPEVKP